MRSRNLDFCAKFVGSCLRLGSSGADPEMRICMKVIFFFFFDGEQSVSRKIW